MSNTIDWGQAAVNNTIDYGQGATDNTINWGKSQTLSPSGETNITGTGSTPIFTNTKSILLDGVDDFVDCGSVSAINSASTVSVSYWGKKTASNKYLLVGSQMSSTNGIWLIWWNDGNVYFAARNGNIGFAGYALSFDTNFHHFVGVYNGSSLKIYIDGILRATSTTSIPSTLSSTAGNDFNIGYLQSQYASGNIDEVSVFNSELSASDVTSIYNNGVPNDISSLSPLSWWRFEGTGTTANDSGSGGNDGTLVNGVTRSTDVPTASSFANTKSIALDGIDDFVICGNDASLQPSNFTICLWVKTDNNNSNRTFIHNGAGDFGSSRMGFLVQQSFGNYYFRIGNGTANTTVFNGGLIVDTWQFLTLSYDGVNMRSYLDGVLQDTAAVSNITYGTNATWNPFYIGRTSGGSQYVSANIDEVSLFNSALSASDITSIYNSGVPNDISSLSPVSWWRCGDGDTAPILTDNAGSNDGTMTNFTTFSTDVPT